MDRDIIEAMFAFPLESEVLRRLMDWAQTEPTIRAMLMTSSRTRPDGPVDLISDYDIVLVVTDTFAREGDWTRAYGEPLVGWGDESVRHGVRTIFQGVVYEDGAKIDYSLWPLDLPAKIAAEPKLPDDLDVGYRVLLDKDGLTTNLQPPTYRAHIPKLPTEAEFIAVIEEFWWNTTYVAKGLWRGEVIFAKWILDADTKLVPMLRILEWKIETLHGWDLKPGVLGRGLERNLPPDLARKLAGTYVGADLQENWEALFRTIALFRSLAQELAAGWGYAYPESLDERMAIYLDRLRSLPRRLSSS